jgi:hypothetical protein
MAAFGITLSLVIVVRSSIGRTNPLTAPLLEVVPLNKRILERYLEEI